MDLEQPRDFRLRTEKEQSTNFSGITYGPECDTDGYIKWTEELKWSGSFITQSGHCIEFMFVCDLNFPETEPLVKFLPNLFASPTSFQDEMKYFSAAVQKICDPTTHELKKNTVAWSPEKSIGQYLTDIRTQVVGKY